jgi:hypothetical protein
MGTQLTDHFSLEELTRTKPGIPNDPPMALAKNLVLIAEKLEQARAIWKCPVVISYGYRCPALNTACGSTSSTSAHLEGLAADAVPTNLTLREAFDALVADPEFMADVDQLIIERGCIHIGLATSKRPGAPRHELRTEQVVNGERHYPLFGNWSPQGVLHV